MKSLSLSPCCTKVHSTVPYSRQVDRNRRGNTVPRSNAPLQVEFVRRWEKDGPLDRLLGQKQVRFVRSVGQKSPLSKPEYSNPRKTPWPIVFPFLVRVQPCYEGQVGYVNKGKDIERPTGAPSFQQRISLRYSLVEKRGAREQATVLLRIPLDAWLAGSHSRAFRGLVHSAVTVLATLNPVQYCTRYGSNAALWFRAGGWDHILVIAMGNRNLTREAACIVVAAQPRWADGAG